jgi:phosphoglucomutase
VDGPLFLAKDTHALSEPAWATALEVFAANDVTVLVDDRDRYTPTPALSHAVLTYNRGRTSGLADGVVVTPSHNPPADGGFKYNPPDGGRRAATSPAPCRTPPTPCCATGCGRAAGAAGPGPRRRTRRRPTTSSARTSTTCRRCSTSTPCARRACASAPTRSAGRASTTGARSPTATASTSPVVNPLVDPTWRFMTLDWDGKIRMDCSSQFAMASLIANKDEYAIATGNDADADRHGVVTPDGGLLAPNAYLAVAIEHLLATRSSWPAGARSARRS